MKLYQKLFLCFLLLVLPTLLWAGDFGLIADQNATLEKSGGEEKLEYTGLIIPRFSFNAGKNTDFYFSFGFKINYRDGSLFMFEMLRTDVTFRFGSAGLRAGRMYYSDPLGCIAFGLFDGARFSADTRAGTFGLGGWYTGLLFKKRARINMSIQESIFVAAPYSFGDPLDNYFAPPHLVAALDWENHGTGGFIGARAALIGQFDLRNEAALAGEDRLHSQYLAVNLNFPLRNFILDLGGCLSLIEQSGDTKIAIAGTLGAAWLPPASFDSRLSFLGNFSSGVIDGSRITAFIPVTSKAQGEILNANLSGLSALTLDYTARLHRDFSVSLSSAYIIRSDLGTYKAYSSDGWFLGNEFYWKFFWSPFSDLYINLGGGIFLFSMGDSASQAKPIWRVDLTAILSLY